MKVRVQMNAKKLLDAEKRGTIWSLGRAGGYIMGIARKSIKKTPDGDYSPPGSPPHTRKGLMRHAIQYDVEKGKGIVVIGPVASEFGDIGRLHEFGGTRKGKLGKRAQGLVSQFGYAATARILGMTEDDLMKRTGPQKYPPRPFMGPALAISRERLPKFWAQSVRGG